MYRRCYDSKNKSYKNYGGRGVRICSEWYDATTGKLNYSNFIRFADENGYSEGLQIDRIDNDGPYAPLNCRWATRIENGRNKRNNHVYIIDGKRYTVAELAEMAGTSCGSITDRIERQGITKLEDITKPPRQAEHIIEYDGERKSIKQWAEKYGMPYDTLKQRIQKMKWPIKMALETPVGVGNSHFIECLGQKRTIKEWSDICGVCPSTIKQRLKCGWPTEKAVTEPSHTCKRRKCG